MDDAIKQVKRLQDYWIKLAGMIGMITTQGSIMGLKSR
jgi:hypothetical protein